MEYLASVLDHPFLMSLIGFSFALISFLIGVYYIVIKLIDPTVTPGLSSTILFITFFSGLNLIGAGFTWRVCRKNLR